MANDKSPHICEVCGKGKGGANHRECARLLQQKYAALRKAAPRKRRQPLLGENHIDYLTKTGNS